MLIKFKKQSSLLNENFVETGDYFNEKNAHKKSRKIVYRLIYWILGIWNSIALYFFLIFFRYHFDAVFALRFFIIFLLIV